MARQSARRRAGHADDLRRCIERKAARRHYRLSQLELRQSAAAAQGGRSCAGARRGGGGTRESAGRCTEVVAPPPTTARGCEVHFVAARAGTLAPHLKST